MAGACYDSAVLMGATPSFIFMECWNARFLLSGAGGSLSLFPKPPSIFSVLLPWPAAVLLKESSLHLPK